MGPESRRSIWEKESTPVRVTFAAVLILGALFRLYHLGCESLWVDEAYSIADSQRGFFTLLFGNLVDPGFSVNSALYFGVLNLWSYLGESEAVLRLLSVIFGVISIVLIYLLGKQLFNIPTALAGAFLIAVNPLHLQHSQEVRGYSLLVLLAILVLILVTRVVREEGRGRSLIWAAVVAGLMFHTHYLSIVFIFCVGVFLAVAHFAWKRPLAPRHVITAVVVLAAFTWKFPAKYLFQSLMRAGLHGEPRHWWLTRSVGTPDLSFVGQIFKSFSVGVEGPPGRVFNLLWILVPVLFLFGLYRVLKTDRGEREERFWIPVAIVFFPMAVLFAYSQFENVFLPKYLIYALPVYLLVIAYGVMSVPRKPVKVVLCGAMLLIMGGSLFSYYQGRKYPDWKGALSRVLLDYREGDVLAFNSGENRVVWEYYRRRMAGDKEVEAYYFGDYSAVDRDVTQYIREISGEYRELLSRYRRVWLISSLVWVTDPQNLVEQIAEAGFRLEGSWPGNPKVALYRVAE